MDFIHDFALAVVRNEQAASYDDRWKTLFPIDQALHFLSAIALAGLPADAQVLCVGAVTGAEIVAGGGFERPTLFYQALFIHAWHAQA